MFNVSGVPVLHLKARQDTSHDHLEPVPVRQVPQDFEALPKCSPLDENVTPVNLHAGICWSIVISEKPRHVDDRH